MEYYIAIACCFGFMCGMTVAVMIWKAPVSSCKCKGHAPETTVLESTKEETATTKNKEVFLDKGFFIDKEYVTYLSCKTCGFRENKKDFPAVHGTDLKHCPVCPNARRDKRFLQECPGKFHSEYGDLLEHEMPGALLAEK